jgi:hypothetical protein
LNDDKKSSNPSTSDSKGEEGEEEGSEAIAEQIFEATKNLFAAFLREGGSTVDYDGKNMTHIIDDWSSLRNDVQVKFHICTFRHCRPG